MSHIVHVPKTRDDLDEIEITTLRDTALIDNPNAEDIFASGETPEGGFRVPIVIELADEKNLILARDALDNDVPQDWDIKLEEAGQKRTTLRVDGRENVGNGVLATAGTAFFTYAAVDIVAKDKKPDTHETLNGASFSAAAILFGYMAYRAFRSASKLFTQLHDTKADFEQLEKTTPLERDIAYARIDDRLRKIHAPQVG
jgi:hypothetical protein